MLRGADIVMEVIFMDDNDANITASVANVLERLQIQLEMSYSNAPQLIGMGKRLPAAVEYRGKIMLTDAVLRGQGRALLLAAIRHACLVYSFTQRKKGSDGKHQRICCRFPQTLS